MSRSPRPARDSSAGRSPPQTTRPDASSKASAASPTGTALPAAPATDPTTSIGASALGGGAVASSRDDRRKQILKAAVKVFADKGYHGCRISDVADEAGVAYGLVYHYYGNKDGLLSAVFDTNWAFFAKAIDDIANQGGPTMFEKLRQIIELAFQAFEMAPLVVKVLVLEYGRNARLGEALENPAVMRVFGSVARIFEQGRRSGELYEGIDPVAMCVLFMGTLETSFVSFMLTNPEAGSKVQRSVSLEAMKKTLLAIIQRAVIGNVARKEKERGA